MHRFEIHAEFKTDGIELQKSISESCVDLSNHLAGDRCLAGMLGIELTGVHVQMLV